MRVPYRATRRVANHDHAPGEQRDTHSYCSYGNRSAQRVPPFQSAGAEDPRFDGGSRHANSRVAAAALSSRSCRDKHATTIVVLPFCLGSLVVPVPIAAIKAATRRSDPRSQLKRSSSWNRFRVRRRSFCERRIGSSVRRIMNSERIGAPARPGSSTRGPARASSGTSGHSSYSCSPFWGEHSSMAAADPTARRGAGRGSRSGKRWKSTSSRDAMPCTPRRPSPYSHPRIKKGPAPANLPRPGKVARESGCGQPRQPNGCTNERAFLPSQRLSAREPAALPHRTQHARPTSRVRGI